MDKIKCVRPGGHQRLLTPQTTTYLFLRQILEGNTSVCERRRHAAFDSTGLDCGRRSFYYVRRRHAGAKRFQTVTYSRYAKLEVSVDCASHLLLAVLVARGPRVDIDRFVPLLEATMQQVRPEAVLADAGYDAESNHREAREERGVRSCRRRAVGQRRNCRAAATGVR